MKKIFFSGIIALILCTLVYAAPSDLDKITREVWLRIGTSKSVCDDFDYFPEGGMRNFACHLGYFISYQKFIELMGVKPFLKGPHDSNQLDLFSNDFGHYNPEFVKKLSRVMIPALKDKKFRNKTRNIYKEFISPLARVHYVTYKKLSVHPEFLTDQKEKYLEAISEGDYFDYEQFYGFMSKGFFMSPADKEDFHPYFDGGYNGNVVKTAVVFWIRRHIDGTAPEFFKGLELLLKTYDPAFKRIADSTDWKRSLIFREPLDPCPDGLFPSP